MDLNELLSSVQDGEMKSAVNTLVTKGVDTLTVDVQKTMVNELRAAKAADLLDRLRRDTQFKAVRKAAKKALDGLRAFGIVPGEHKKPAAKKVRDILSNYNTVVVKPSDKMGLFRILFNVPEKGGVGPEIPMLSMRGNRILTMSVFESSTENARRIGKYIDGLGSMPITELPYDETAKFVLDALDVSQAQAKGFTIEHAAHIAAMFRPFRDKAGLVATMDAALAEINETGNDTLAQWEAGVSDPMVRGAMKRAAGEALDSVVAVDDAQRINLAKQSVMKILNTFFKEYAPDMGVYFRFAAYSKYKAGEPANAAALFRLAKAMDEPEATDLSGFSVFQGIVDRMIQAVADEKAAKEAKEADEPKDGEQDEGKD